MHKANDDILLPEPAIDDEECQMEASASSSSISCHPMVTPHGRHREIDIQVGNSLGKERVIVPRVSNGAARLEVLKTPAPQKGIEEAEHPPLEYAGNDDDDNNDVPGFCDDGPESEGVEDQQAAEDRILANEPKSSIRPEPSIAPAHAHKPEAEPDTAAGPSKSRGRPAGATKRPREMLKKETEAERRGRKSLAGDGLVVDETNGTRRSSRAHQRPLEYWRNEHKVFGRDHQSKFLGSISM